MTHYYKLDLAPTALARCGYNKNSGRVYDKQAHLKLATSLSLRAQHDNKPMLVGPLEMKVIFHFAMPMSRKKEYAKLLGSPMYIVPDADNCLKLICDVAQIAGIYKNDCQVASLCVSKVYAYTGYTEVWISEMLCQK